MRPEDLLARLEDHPFKGFRVHLSDGSSVDVVDPGMIMVGRSSAVLPIRYGKDEEGRRLVERWRTVALVHIVQFSDLDERLNGKRKRSR